ncbi:MAG: hypothetical protein KDK45_16825 [Leptospiraceae bacterium]|nr:hypothetical protein [Leptospiraceae bacterium]
MSKNLNWSEKFTEKVKLVFPNLQKELDKKEQEQEKKEKEILEKREKLNQDKAGLEEKVQNLEAELETTSHENYLSNFIEEKGGGDSYKKYLGIITQIRNDFQKLSSLLTNYNQSLEAEDNTSADNTYLVNRIVLYIDDLDRLPPEKVLQTIQAIRLLLSFEAFVVVVSVDSKWLSGVLNANFRQIFGDSSSRDTEGDGQVDLYRTSSYDYLEKIFQIPLWLTPMNLEGRQNLLNYLMEKDLLVAHGLAEDMEKAVKATQEFNSLTGSSLPEQSLPEEKEKIQILSKDWSFAEPDEKQFRIQKREHEFSLKIAPLLGRFPRSLKRFVNIYRLIKVGLSKLQWEVYFLDINPVTGYSGREGTVRNFEVVMFLLAVITGLPYTSRVFFRTLKLSEKDNLKDLLEKIGVIKTEKSWDILGVKREEVLFSGNKITNSPGNKNPDFLSLQAEFIHLTSWLDKNANQKWMNLELDQLRYWEPHVSRYSFRVEPIMFGDE